MPFQAPIACSTGASARPSRIDAAIIAPGGELPVDHQRRASPKDQNLHEDADELGEADQRGIAIGGGELQGEHALVATAPTGQKAREHPHRVKGVSVADGLISALDVGDRQDARVPERRARDEFVEDRERNNTIAEAMPIMPKTGCISQITARKIGVHGASKMVLHPGPPRTARTCARSRSGCALAALLKSPRAGWRR